MAAPSVWEEEELRVGDIDAGANPVVGRTPWQLFWVRFRRDKVALAALTFLALLIAVAILAGPITRAVAHPPDAQFPKALDPQFGTPTGPSSTFLFGVDKVGEDVFSRVLYGARVSLEVAFIATFLSVAIGVVLGMVAGYYRGLGLAGTRGHARRLGTHARARSRQSIATIGSESSFKA